MFDEVVAAADRNLDVMLNYLGAVPQDEKIRVGVCEQSPVVCSYPESRASIAFKKLAKTINSWPEPKQAIGHVEFFVERLVMQGVSE